LNSLDGQGQFVYLPICFTDSSHSYADDGDELGRTGRQVSESTVSWDGKDHMVKYGEAVTSARSLRMQARFLGSGPAEHEREQ